MKKKSAKKERGSSPSPFFEAGRTPEKFNWKLLLLLVANTVAILGFYLAAIRFYYFEYTLAFYMALTAGFSIGYVVYNRGFSRRGVTPDMLPDTMTPEEKYEFIADGERRMKKSKWMLTVIIPLIFTFAYELITLYLADFFISIFS